MLPECDRLFGLIDLHMRVYSKNRSVCCVDQLHHFLRHLGRLSLGLEHLRNVLSDHDNPNWIAVGIAPCRGVEKQVHGNLRAQHVRSQSDVWRLRLEKGR